MINNKIKFYMELIDSSSKEFTNIVVIDKIYGNTNIHIDTSFDSSADANNYEFKGWFINRKGTDISTGSLYNRTTLRKTWNDIVKDSENIKQPIESGDALVAKWGRKKGADIYLLVEGIGKVTGFAYYNNIPEKENIEYESTVRADSTES